MTDMKAQSRRETLLRAGLDWVFARRYCFNASPTPLQENRPSNALV